MERRFGLPFVALLAMTLLCSSITLPVARAAAPTDGAKVAHWKTWVLASGSEIAVPAPPADNSDQTRKELDELRQLQAQRDAMGNTAIQFYNAVPATQRWHEELMAQGVAAKLNGNRHVRLLGIFHTALNDAVIAAYAAKYQYNRKPPSQLAPDITTVATVGGAPISTEPSYPSEHAAIAGTAAALLTAWFPADEANVKAMAAEVGKTRLAMGANYRSDIDAGMALGQAVAQKALARAATDGSDAVWTGTVPTGPGRWVLAPGTTPVEPLQGQWKPWLMARGDQFRPGPPPAYDSAQTKEELALIKRITSNPTPSQRAIATFPPTLGPNYYYLPVFAVLQREQEGPARETRVLSLVATAAVDSAIASHDCKFFYWRARPNMLDPTIVPLIGQPNHPSYVHTAVAIVSMFSEVTGYFYPQDLAAFRYRAEEFGFSAIYGGIHFPSDVSASNAMGQQIAALAIQRDQLNGP
jgi:membrane-associated phospholipid phosphatase